MKHFGRTILQGFRSKKTPLWELQLPDQAPPCHLATVESIPAPAKSSPARDEPSTATATKPPCAYFRRGQCRFGANCRFAHDDVSPPPPVSQHLYECALRQCSNPHRHCRGTCQIPTRRHGLPASSYSVRRSRRRISHNHPRPYFSTGPPPRTTICSHAQRSPRSTTLWHPLHQAQAHSRSDSNAVEHPDNIRPPPSQPPALRTHKVYADYQPITGQVFTDQTGRFIVPSSSGNCYTWYYTTTTATSFMPSP
jgi:hypothetical protein